MPGPLKNLKDIFTQKKKKLPLHMGVNCTALRQRTNALPEDEKRPFLDSYLTMVEDISILMVEMEIPITTFLLLRATQRRLDDELLTQMASFFERLAVSSFIRENQVKITVMGKWYDLPTRVVDGVKLMLEETRGYDRNFLNFCLFYDGQEELADGMRIMLTKIQKERIEPEVDYASIKENLASSYFLPPDMIYVPDDRRRTDGLLLWDSKNSVLYLDNKPFDTHGLEGIRGALDLFQRR